MPKKLPPEVTAYLSAQGTRGGKVSSEAKAAAARENGKKGGRPRKDTMTTYAIYSESGSELTTGIRGEQAARKAAQALADDMGETVYLDTVPSSTDPDDDEDCGEAIEPA